MKVTCFALETGGGIRPEAEATALAGWRAGAGPYWIDIGGGRPEDVTAWLAGLGLDPGLLDLLQSERTKRESSRWPSPCTSPTRDAGAEAGKPARFGCLCLDRLVITMHEQPDEPRRTTKAR